MVIWQSIGLINKPLSEFRKICGLKNKTGKVDVIHLNLSYYNKPIACIVFGRCGIVEYIDSTGKCFCTFQNDVVWFDE